VFWDKKGGQKYAESVPEWNEPERIRCDRIRSTACAARDRDPADPDASAQFTTKHGQAAGIDRSKTKLVGCPVPQNAVIRERRT